jgi:hypothetical protein
MWLSDPLLVYALTLTSLLVAGIFFMMASIVLKHRRRLHSVRIEHRIVSLLNDAIHQSKSESTAQSDFSFTLAQINQLIDAEKKDVANGWMRLLEKTPPDQRSLYTEIAKQTHMVHCIPHCLYEEGLLERCIALEAIGLSGFENFAPEAEKFTKTKGVAPYACIALARLKEVNALPTILESYQLGVLSTTQALAAITEIPTPQLTQALREGHPAGIPAPLAAYLEA